MVSIGGESVFSTPIHRFLLFCCSGTLAFCVDYSIVSGLVYLGMLHWIARILSFIAAATCTWRFNSRITFKDAAARLTGFAGWFGYMGTALIGGTANYFVYLCVLHVLGTVDQISLFFGVAAGSCAGLAINYFLCSVCFFKSKSRCGTLGNP